MKDIKKIFEQPTFASKGGLKEFNDEQRAKGWESIGKEAPESTQFNVLQNDVERGVKYLYGQIRGAIRSTSSKYVPDERKETDLREAIEGITKAQTAQAIQQAKNDAAGANKNAESRLSRAANLSDISDKHQAREHLGLGKLALEDNYPEANLGQKGIVQLSSATNSNDETMAATPKAVKAAYDLAASPAVKSVNGKKGEVRLTTDDIGAFSNAGGTVKGDIMSQGGQIGLKGDDRKHLGFHNQDGSVRMWLYKNKSGDGVRLNNGDDGGGEYVFHKDGGFRAPASVHAGAARMAADGNIHGSQWGNQWLDVYLRKTFQPKKTGLVDIVETGSGTGYYWRKFSDGKIEIFGRLDATIGAPLDVVFPKAFTEIPLIFVKENGTTGDNGWLIRVRNLSKTGFTVGWNLWSESGRGSAIDVCYHAIGS